MRLVAGQAGLIRIKSDAVRFANAAGYRHLSFSTGYGLSLGDTDSNWRVVAMDGKPVTELAPLRVTEPLEVRPEKLGDLGLVPVRWLVIPKSLTNQTEQRDRAYTCRCSFELPTGLDLSRADLVLGYQGGRAINAVRVNGHELILSDAAKDQDSFYTPFETQTIDQHLLPGMNTIEIELYDTDDTTTLRASLEVVPD